MRRAAIALAVAALLPAAAAAQVELSALLGYRSGDSSFLVEAEVPSVACLVPPCVVAEAGTPESEALGLVLDVPLRDGWMLEALLNRQDAELGLTTGASPEAGAVTPESFELTVLQVGLMRRWVRAGLTPFTAFAAGVARAETSAGILTPPIRPGDTGRRPGSEERLSASAGGGVRVPLVGRWALRLEARGYWIDLPEELGGELVQFEVAVGLSARL